MHVNPQAVALGNRQSRAVAGLLRLALHSRPAKPALPDTQDPL